VFKVKPPHHPRTHFNPLFFNPLFFKGVYICVARKPHCTPRVSERAMMQLIPVTNVCLFKVFLKFESKVKFSSLGRPWWEILLLARHTRSAVGTNQTSVPIDRTKRRANARTPTICWLETSAVEPLAVCAACCVALSAAALCCATPMTNLCSPIACVWVQGKKKGSKKGGKKKGGKKGKGSKKGAKLSDAQVILHTSNLCAVGCQAKCHQHSALQWTGWT
jgi:hypothetical protein